MTGRMARPITKRKAEYVEETHALHADKLVLLRNPWDERYVINGCPNCCRNHRWVMDDLFYQDDASWVCEVCDNAYSEEHVRAVLEADNIRKDIDVLEWPIKYAWAGDYPVNQLGHACPACGSMKTVFGHIHLRSGPVPSQLYRWVCTDCAQIFDLLDLPAYWTNTYALERVDDQQ